MDKDKLTNSLIEWLKSYSEKKYSDNFNIIDVFAPQSSLSKINNQYFKECDNYSAWDFKPDILAILQDKKDASLKFILINRSISGLSLKEIGELNCYAKVLNAADAFLVSTKGISSEVGVLLLEKNIQDRVLQYNPGKFITIFGWDEENNNVKSDSIFPLGVKI